MQLDWSQLPDELLQVVANKFNFIRNYVRFRAVCRTWRWQTSPRPRHLPPQVPWLMLPYNPYSNETHQRSFLNLLNGMVVTLGLPETHLKWCCGSSHGWLVLQQGIKISLLNPITRQQIQLPLLTYRPKVLRIPPPSGVSTAPNDGYVYKLDFVDCFIKKVVLSANPSAGSDCIIMAILRSGEKLAFCRIGDESWTFIHDPRSRDQMIDVVYRDGRFFWVNKRGRVTVYDIVDPCRIVLTSEAPLRKGRYLLVQEYSSGSELLMVARNSRTNEANCKVFKMTLKGIPEWVEVHNIGERMIFLSDGHQCFSLLTGDFEGLITKNCISLITRQDMQSSISYRRSVFSLEEGLVAEASDLEPSASYWSQPLWITPSLC